MWDPRVTTGVPWGDRVRPHGDNLGWPAWGPAVTMGDQGDCVDTEVTMWDVG